MTRIWKEENKRAAKIKRLETYFSIYQKKEPLGHEQIEQLFPAEMQQLAQTRGEIIELMKQADEIADRLREKIKTHLNSQT